MKLAAIVNGESGGESDHSFHAGLAQRLELRCYIPRVGGSNPSACTLKGNMMKIISFEADSLLDVINQFCVWKDANEVQIYSVRQVFSIDEPCEMTVWYF